MTKVRPPLTIEDATFRVIGAIGMDAAIQATGRTADYLRSLTDPNKRYKLTVEDQIKLDLAHIAGGFEGAPIHEAASLLLDLGHGERFSDKHKFVHLVATFIKEMGDAGRALILASLPGSGASQKQEAARETAEAIGAGKVLMSFLKRDRDAPPGQAPP